MNIFFQSENLKNITNKDYSCRKLFFFFFDNKKQGPSSLMHFFLTCIQAARSKWMHGDL